MYKGLLWIFLLGGSFYFVADALYGGNKFGQLLTELTPEKWGNFSHDFYFILMVIGGVIISDMILGDKVTIIFLLLVLLGMLLSNTTKITSMLGRIGKA